MNDREQSASAGSGRASGKRPGLETIVVHTAPGDRTKGLLLADGRLLRCALGRSGISSRKREGDGHTPVGRFSLLAAFIRTERVAIRAGGLPLHRITPRMGWCDSVGDRNYNRAVAIPYPASHERMMRDDHLYDIVIVLDHNMSRHLGVGGSAIFFHLAHADYRPTEGCVAISRTDMLWLWPRLGQNTTMIIG